jgi:hypothetical protein
MHIENQSLTSEIYLVSRNDSKIETTAFTVTDPKLNIEDNYNYDFIPVHKYIFHRLSNNNDKGFVLVFGKMGTGKTTYIR